jgi:hypothetical protein
MAFYFCGSSYVITNNPFYRQGVFFSVAKTAALYFVFKGVDMIGADYNDAIRAYFMATKQRFDADILVSLMEAGGLTISKSFARAILNTAQQAKYKRKLKKSEFIVFVSALAGKYLIPEQELTKDLLECVSFDDLIQTYVNHLKFKG